MSTKIITTKELEDNTTYIFNGETGEYDDNKLVNEEMFTKK